VSGDLVAMRENFVLLEPLLSGAFVASGTVISGALQWDGSQWQTGVIVSGIRRINGNGAVSGYALVYNSATDVYEPQAVSGAGGGGASPAGEYVAHLTMVSGGTFLLADNTTTVISSCNIERHNVGGFTTGSGYIEVPTGSGYTHARVGGFLCFSGDAGAIGVRQVSIIISGGAQAGAGHDGISTYFYGSIPYAAMTFRLPHAGTSQVFLTYNSPVIPISGGERFSLAGFHNQGSFFGTFGGGVNQEGAQCFLSVQCFKLTSGGVG